MVPQTWASPLGTTQSRSFFLTHQYRRKKKMDLLRSSLVARDLASRDSCYIEEVGCSDILFMFYQINFA